MAGNVKKLDTINFNDTIQAYAAHIKKFEGIVSGVKKTTNTIVDRWKGEGCKTFDKDCKQVQLNLKDISDIMYNIRDALTNAHAEYMKTDEALSKSYES